MSSTPRGVRLNNPGNIEKGQKWQGLDNYQLDSRFATFKSAAMGIRALTKILLTYHSKHKLSTLRGIINRYAPPHENLTDKYIENVSNWTKIGPDAIINFNSEDTLINIVMAITRQEQGYVPWSTHVYEQGVKMALDND